MHGHRLDPFDPPDAPGLLSAFFQETAVRPPFGRHPRLSVYGLLEARLQRADLMVLGGWHTRQMLDRYGREEAGERARDAYRKRSFGDRL